MARQPNQQDVADLAGVSRATVSYVMNGRSGGNVRITDETRQKVLAAIKTLGYQPNGAARSLRTQQTRLLGVMVPELANPFFPLLIRGIQSVADEHDYRIVVFYSDIDPLREREYIDLFVQRWVDGVIINPVFLKETDIARLTQAGISVGLLADMEMDGVDTVVGEDFKGIAEAIAYLVSKGHTRIAHVAAGQNTMVGNRRLQGYREALSLVGLPYDETLVRYGSLRTQQIDENVLSLFDVESTTAPPTAVFVATDALAIELMRLLQSRGWRIPENVAICGFDNVPAAGLVTPSLTTIDHNAEQIGRLAAELLFQRLEGNEDAPSQRIAAPCFLVPRASA